MFQDRIPLKENNPLKVVLCVLRSFLLFRLNMMVPLELKILHTKHEIEVPVFYSASFGKIVWD